MNAERLLDEFIKSEDTFRAYKDGELIFRSAKKQLLPLLDYIAAFVPQVKGVTIFDRVIGNAAALLLRKALCFEVYGLIISQLAINSLNEFGIKYNFLKLVPYISNHEGNDMCPMERLSLGKTPEEFYQVLKVN